MKTKLEKLEDQLIQDEQLNPELVKSGGEAEDSLTEEDLHAPDDMRLARTD